MYRFVRDLKVCFLGRPVSPREKMQAQIRLARFWHRGEAVGLLAVGVWALIGVGWAEHHGRGVDE